MLVMIKVCEAARINYSEMIKFVRRDSLQESVSYRALWRTFGFGLAWMCPSRIKVFGSGCKSKGCSYTLQGKVKNVGGKVN